MTTRHRVVIADHHALLRAGLRALLALDPNLEVVGEATHARGALEAVVSLRPHLIVIDLTLPGANGMEAITHIKLHHPDVLVLVMTLEPGEIPVHAALRAGANGYILKDSSRDEFLSAISVVLQGGTYLSPDISGLGGDGHEGGHKAAAGETSYDSLTRREREVLKLVAQGRSNKWIAEFLGLSAKTVEKHRGNLMRKLGLHNASMLTAYALAKGQMLSGTGDS
jgi:DNA-binding NarL/FixJ family response regulator